MPNGTFSPRIVPANDLTDAVFGTGTAKSQICSFCHVGFIYTRQVEIGGRWYVVGECGQCQRVELRRLHSEDLIAVGDTKFPGLIAIKSDRVGAGLKRALFLMKKPVKVPVSA